MQSPRGQQAGARIMLGLSLCIGGAEAVVSDPSFASSPIPVGAGPRALGMGGAFSAVADDASAATWNPAGMVQLERPEIGLSGGWYHRRTRQADHSSEDHDEIDLDHASAILPFHAFGCQQTIGVSWQRQFDFGRSLSAAARFDDGMSIADQTVDIDVEGALTAWGASYALEIFPGLSLGITGHAWGDDLTGRSHYRKDVHETNVTEFVFPPIVSTGTLDEHRETEVSQGYSAVIGVWWQAIPELTIAVVVKPTYKLRLRTDTTVLLTSDGNPAPPQHDHGSADFHYPTTATLGLAWRQGDQGALALDLTWTQWSRYRLIENGDTISPVNSSIAPRDFSDGIAVRLGYEHLLLFDEIVVAARVGGSYEEIPGAAPSPSLLEGTDTHAVLDRYYGVSLGTSLCFDHLLYDLAAQVRYGHDVATGQDTAPDSAADVTNVIVRLGLAYQF